MKAPTQQLMMIDMCHRARSLLHSGIGRRSSSPNQQSNTNGRGVVGACDASPGRGLESRSDGTLAVAVDHTGTYLVLHVYASIPPHAVSDRTRGCARNGTRAGLVTAVLDRAWFDAGGCMKVPRERKRDPLCSYMLTSYICIWRSFTCFIVDWNLISSQVSAFSASKPSSCPRRPSGR